MQRIFFDPFHRHVLNSFAKELTEAISARITTREFESSPTLQVKWTIKTAQANGLPSVCLSIQMNKFLWGVVEESARNIAVTYDNGDVCARILHPKVEGQQSAVLELFVCSPGKAFEWRWEPMENNRTPIQATEVLGALADVLEKRQGHTALKLFQGDMNQMGYDYEVGLLYNTVRDKIAVFTPNKCQALIATREQKKLQSAFAKSTEKKRKVL
jgi:hypothetical protein